MATIVFLSHNIRLTQNPLTVTFTSDLEIQEDYAKRSGGERKRTDLVTLFAMFELIRQHSRYQAEFMILDEVFDALDSEGLKAVQQVIQMLSDRVKKLLVITHSEALKGN
jgi:DNA repair exonuclease SbcCD ATPase subunit